MNESKWFEKHDNLTAFASVLIDLGTFERPKDVLYFFEKPWKWEPEWERWVALGKPLDLDDIEVLAEHEEFAKVFRARSGHLASDDTGKGGTP